MRVETTMASITTYARITAPPARSRTNHRRRPKGRVVDASDGRARAQQVAAPAVVAPGPAAVRTTAEAPWVAVVAAPARARRVAVARPAVAAPPLAALGGRGTARHRCV